nr:GNAT family N-acetyltransferase [Streptomyces sp. DH-12]
MAQSPGTTLDPLVERARALWQDLAGAPVEFGRSAAGVVVSPASTQCPPSWCGIVVLDGAGITTVPTDEVAAAHQAWPRRTAHPSVLTAPEHRGRGPAKTGASAAVAHALGAGLMPQWRARRASSRRVARSLGFREIGAQSSVRLGEDGGAAPATIRPGLPSRDR